MSEYMDAIMTAVTLLEGSGKPFEGEGVVTDFEKVSEILLDAMSRRTLLSST